jgi:lipopolysaccharide/colanic/teichoic acid biosynthesis glycosyltransferase
LNLQPSCDYVLCLYIFVLHSLASLLIALAKRITSGGSILLNGSCVYCFVSLACYRR